MKPNKSFALAPTFLVDPENVLDNRSLVRTGTYSDGNCFFHALLRAIDIQYRKQTTHYAHLRIVEQFRKNLVEWITPEVFQSLGNGEQVRLYFMTEFNLLLEESSKNEENDALLDIIHKLLPYSVIEREILPLVLNKHSDSFYKLFCWQTEKYIRAQLTKTDSQKVQLLCSHMRNHFIRLFKSAHQNAIEKFKTKMQTMGEYVDSFQMECISKYTGYNFVFIDETRGNGYSGISHMVNFDENRKCLVFLWVDENHFEIVGEVEHKNIINRIFDSDDKLIQTLVEQHAIQT
jgi:hypothetical protein